MSTVQDTISITEGRKRLFDIAHDVQTKGRSYTLTHDGSPQVVLMSADEYESWIETLEVLSDFPNIKKEVAETKSARTSGTWKKWSTLDDLKHDWKVLAPFSTKTKKPYGVRTRTKTIGKKSAR
jgi:prevent-host-death family protein